MLRGRAGCRRRRDDDTTLQTRRRTGPLFPSATGRGQVRLASVLIVAVAALIDFAEAGASARQPRRHRLYLLLLIGIAAYAGAT